MQNFTCFNCKHYITDLTCMAFIDGIPEKILLDINIHDEVVDGQFLDFVYEPKEKENEPN